MFQAVPSQDLGSNIIPISYLRKIYVEELFLI